jgi:hypothetical protein
MYFFKARLKQVSLLYKYIGHKWLRVQLVHIS